MDKLADGLQKLGEDDLLQVVQMVHDHKAPDSYTKNDVERMSFLPTPCFLSRFDLRWMLTPLLPRRGRIPCRSLHTTRTSHQDVVGFYARKGRFVMICFVFSHLVCCKLLLLCVRCCLLSMLIISYFFSQIGSRIPGFLSFLRNAFVLVTTEWLDSIVYHSSKVENACIWHLK